MLKFTDTFSGCCCLDSSSSRVWSLPLSPGFCLSWTNHTPSLTMLMFCSRLSPASSRRLCFHSAVLLLHAEVLLLNTPYPLLQTTGFSYLPWWLLQPTVNRLPVERLKKPRKANQRSSRDRLASVDQPPPPPTGDVLVMVNFWYTKRGGVCLWPNAESSRLSPGLHNYTVVVAQLISFPGKSQNGWTSYPSGILSATVVHTRSGRVRQRRHETVHCWPSLEIAGTLLGDANSRWVAVLQLACYLQLGLVNYKTLTVFLFFAVLVHFTLR